MKKGTLLSKSALRILSRCDKTSAFRPRMEAWSGFRSARSRIFRKPWALARGASFAFCVLFVFGCSDTRYVAEKLFWEAERAAARILKDKSQNLTDKDYDEIVAAYRKVITKCPLETYAARAHFKISNIYAAQKKYTAAQQELKTIIQNFSSAPQIASQAQFTIGKIFEIQKKQGLALTEYEKVSDLYPLSRLGLRTPLYVLRYLRAEKNEGGEKKAYDRAIKQYRALLGDYQGTSVAPTIQHYIAMAHIFEENYTEAISAWDSIISDNPNTPQALNAFLAKADIAAKKLKDTAGAIQIYNEIMKKFPENSVVIGAQSQAGWLYLQNSMIEKAKESFYMVLENEKAEEQLKVNSYLGLAYAYRKEKNIEKAVESYKTIQTEFPRSKAAIAVPFLTAQYLSEENASGADGALKEAIDGYEETLAHSKGREEEKVIATHYLCLAYLKDNQPQKALFLLQELAEKYPRNPGYLLDIAAIYSMIKEPDKAIEVYKELIDKYTDNAYLVNLSKERIKALEEIQLE